MQADLAADGGEGKVAFIGEIPRVTGDDGCGMLFAPLLTSGASRDGPDFQGSARVRAFPSRLMEGSAPEEHAAVAL